LAQQTREVYEFDTIQHIFQFSIMYNSLKRIKSILLESASHALSLELICNTLELWKDRQIKRRYTHRYFAKRWFISVVFWLLKKILYVLLQMYI